MRDNNIIRDKYYTDHCMLNAARKFVPATFGVRELNMILIREENQNGNENCEKRKATSPPHQTNGSEKRIKVEQEVGTC